MLFMGDFMAKKIAPDTAKTNVFTQLNDRIAPIGALLGTIAAIITALITLGQHALDWSATILIILSVIGGLSLQTIFYALIVQTVLDQISDLSDNVNITIAMIIGLVLSLWIYGLPSPTPNNVTAFIGFVIVAYLAWVLVKKLTVKPPEISK
jgi:hypothetical protein